MSALLTLLLAVLLTGPLGASDAAAGRYPATAFAELDVAQGAASLNGRQSARDATEPDSIDDGDAGDAAIPIASVGAADSGAGRNVRPQSASAAGLRAPRAYQARAPPTA